MTTRLSRLFLLAAAICVVGGLRAPLRAADPPPNADLLDLPLALDHTPDAPLVLRVSQTLGGSNKKDVPGRDPGIVSAARGEELYITVQRLNEWIKAVKEQGKTDKTDIIDLVLYLNGSPLPGLHPDRVIAFHETIGAPAKRVSGTLTATDRPGRLRFVGNDSIGAPATAAEVIEYTERPVHYLHFILDSTPDCRAAWHQLLRRPDFDARALDVSVGFVDGRMLRTYVSSNGRQKFEIVTLPPLRFWSGVAIILASLLIFLVLARETDIIRDVHAPLRPDGRWPYSLARAQLACWFFLVLTSFFFLWVLTGEMDTLNTSVLTLLGISAGTALGAAFVDSAHEPGSPEEAGRGLAAVDLSKPKRETCRQLSALLLEAEHELLVIEAERAVIDEKNKQALDRNGLEYKRAQDRIRVLKLQIKYFEQPTWKGVLYDLLVERGVVSFHRFQILVWTLVLGLMFVAGVYSETAMPEFNATLLGLLGVSGGTFVGFKLPAMQKEA